MAAQTDDPQMVVRAIRIAAPPAFVFPYFIDPEKLVRWMGVEATLDPEPNGAFRVRINDAHTIVGEYVEIRSPERVVFTWGWEGDVSVPPGSSVVEVTLEANGDGTDVRLAHSGLPNAERRRSHTEGWDHYMPRLLAAAEGRPFEPDPWSVPTHPNLPGQRAT